MPKFRVVVTEKLSLQYRPVEIEAEDEEEAAEIAEEMREEGKLTSEYGEQCDDVDVNVHEVGPDDVLRPMHELVGGDGANARFARCVAWADLVRLVACPEQPPHDALFDAVAEVRDRVSEEEGVQSATFRIALAVLRLAVEMAAEAGDERAKEALRNAGDAASDVWRREAEDVMAVILKVANAAMQDESIMAEVRRAAAAEQRA